MSENRGNTCSGVIDLARPDRAERVRDFQPPWRTVYVYRCPVCERPVRVRASSFRGRQAVPSVGAIRCGGFVVVEQLVPRAWDGAR